MGRISGRKKQQQEKKRISQLISSKHVFFFFRKGSSVFQVIRHSSTRRWRPISRPITRFTTTASVPTRTPIIGYPTPRGTRRRRSRPIIASRRVFHTILSIARRASSSAGPRWRRRPARGWRSPRASGSRRRGVFRRSARTGGGVVVTRWEIFSSTFHRRPRIINGSRPRTSQWAWTARADAAVRRIPSGRRTASVCRRPRHVSIINRRVIYVQQDVLIR